MNALASILLDHNIAAQLTRELRALGHGCRTAQEMGLARRDDPGVLLWAATERHIVVTHDENDFEMLHHAWRLWSIIWGVEVDHFGIIAVLQSPTWPHDRAAREIDQLVRERGPLANQFYKFRLPDGWLVQD